MSDLHHALGDITSIRRQMARSTQFHGYGPLTIAGTAVAAMVTAVLQPVIVPEPAAHLHRYLALWIMTAVLGSSLAGWQILRRTERLHSGLSGEMLRTAVEQFLPASVTGLLLTVVIVHWAASAGWMIPGLWQIFFGLGVFSSCRFLPRAMVAAGAWYLLAGLVTLALGDARALAPWTMGVAFGAGQLLVALTLQLFVPAEDSHGA